MLATAVSAPPAPVAPPAAPVVARFFVPPAKRHRRTATGVLAGYFEERPLFPGRNALTSLLNGVGPVNWQAAVRAEHERRGIVLPKGQFSVHAPNIAGIGGGKHKKDSARKRSGLPKSSSTHALDFYDSYPAEDGSTFWDDDDETAELPALPSATALPPTPGRSISSSTTSNISSKRPVTPGDLDATSPQSPSSPTFPRRAQTFKPVQKRRQIHIQHSLHSAAGQTARHTRPRARSSTSELDEPSAKRIKMERSGSTFSVYSTSSAFDYLNDMDGEAAGGEGSAAALRRPRRPRKGSSAKKGWKGWVEVEETDVEPASLIRLDKTPPLKERRTRSGKAFDAIALGDLNWV